MADVDRTAAQAIKKTASVLYACLGVSAMYSVAGVFECIFMLTC